MRKFRRILVALVIGLVGPALPGAALAGGGGGGVIGGGGVVVTVDAPTPAGHNYAFLDYFSRSVTVHQGDVVTWSWQKSSEPHTVTFLPAGIPLTRAATGRLFPSAGSPLPDADDGAHALPAIHFNADLQSGCGNSPYFPGTGACSYTGHSAISSGFLDPRSLPSRGEAPAYSVRIDSAPGIYHYFCLIHGPLMSGTIQVVPPNKPVDTQSTINARAAAQYHAAWTHAEAFQTHVVPPHRVVNSHTQWQVLTGAQFGRVTINEFLPAHVNAKPGDSIFWTPGFHTVTFPSESGLPPFDFECEGSGRDKPYAGTLAGCADFELGISPKSDLPSGPPGKAYTGGFYNSGILVIPKPKVWTATFPSGGTFHYDCLIHPGMDAAVTVS